MFIEYQVYDEITDTLSRGISTFTGIDYDYEWKLATINFIDNNDIVFQLDASAYSDLFASIKESILNNDKIFELGYVCVMDDDSIDYIESALKDASQEYQMSTWFRFVVKSGVILHRRF